MSGWCRDGWMGKGGWRAHTHDSFTHTTRGGTISPPLAGSVWAKAHARAVVLGVVYSSTPSLHQLSHASPHSPMHPFPATGATSGRAGAEIDRLAGWRLDQHNNGSVSDRLRLHTPHLQQPTQQAMGGEPSKILAEPALYHGGANVLRDREWFERNGVTHALSVCSQRPPVAFGLTQTRQIDVVRRVCVVLAWSNRCGSGHAPGRVSSRDAFYPIQRPNPTHAHTRTYSHRRIYRGSTCTSTSRT